MNPFVNHAARPTGSRPLLTALGGVLGILPLYGCGNAPTESDPTPIEKLGRTEKAFVSTDPPRGPSTSGNMPELAEQGANLPDGMLSNFAVLASAPGSMDEAWLGATTDDAFASPVAMRDRLRTARDTATSIVRDNRTEYPAAVQEVSNWFPNVTLGSTTDQTVGYKPEFGRWRSARVSTSDGAFAQEMPLMLAEFEQRGMKLYCAARNAERQQSNATRVMGRTSLVNLDILGANLRVMSIEPTLSMAKPMRFDSGQDDGAQAFVIPMSAGVRVTPVSFLPSLPELRTPVVMVTGDSSVASRSNQVQNDYQEWVTLGHMDGFASTTHDAFTVGTGKFVLFSIGFIDIMGEVTLNVGSAACSQGGSYQGCRDAARSQVGRLVVGSRTDGGPITGLATPTRSGSWTIPGFMDAGAYNDAPWIIELPEWDAIPTGAGGRGWRASLPNPFAARMLQNNDKALDVFSNATVTLGLSAGKEFEIADWFKVGATVTGSIGAGLSMVHSFREREEILTQPPPPDVQEFAMPFSAPVTSFTVTPSSQGDFTFGTNAGLAIKLKLPILGWLERDLELWSAEAHESTSRKTWPEGNRFRMDTLVGNDAPYDTRSHWPRSGQFSTYSDVDQCLPPDTTQRDFPPKCAPTSATTPPPSEQIDAQICYYRQIWPTGPDQYPDSPEGMCWTELYDWLKAGVNKEQTFKNDWVISRVLSTSNALEIAGLQGILASCESRYNAAGLIEEFKEKVVQFGVCDGNGTLYENVMQPSPVDAGAPQAGPEGQGSSCQ